MSRVPVQPTLLRWARERAGYDADALTGRFPRRGLDVEAARLLWEASTERIKLSDFAEAFFRRVAERLGHAMLLRKGDLHQLVHLVDPQSISGEVSETLDLLKALFDAAKPGEGA